MYLTPVVPGYPFNDLVANDNLHPTRPRINFINKLRLTQNLQDADYALVPHDWRIIKNDAEYVSYLEHLSAVIPILIFNFGDRTSECTIKNCLQLRTHLWPWDNEFRKIIVPYPSKNKDLTLRDWKKKPTVSFMGHIPKLGPRSFLGKSPRAALKPIKSSVYLVRKISVFKISKFGNMFDLKITKRAEFTAYPSNPKLKQFTEEYELLLSQSDYILCPRGESNTSVRFYETLSAGATPILINTDGGLPKLSSKYNWKNHILEVDLFSNWKEIIINDWKNLEDNQNYAIRQLSNHNLFVEELYIESYLSRLFEDYLLLKVH
jgi:hypothetical protein